MARIWKMAMGLAFLVTLAGCEQPVSNLLLPLEPTPQSVAAGRRQLTPAEKETISDAVSLKMGGTEHRDFRWAPLVLRPEDGAFAYCGMVSRSDVEDGHDVFNDYYVKLAFDRSRKLTTVEVDSVDDKHNDEYGVPTQTESKCVRSGYGIFR